jgi:hypothetical protein
MGRAMNGCKGRSSAVFEWISLRFSCPAAREECRHGLVAGIFELADGVVTPLQVGRRCRMARVKSRTLADYGWTDAGG